MNFLNTYTKYKNLYIIGEDNVNSLATLFQQEYLKQHKVKKYNDLTDVQKDELQNYIKDKQKNISNLINKITTNQHYQSWIIKQINNKLCKFPEDFDDVKYNLNQYIKLLKKDVLPPEEKQIDNLTIQDVTSIVDDYFDELVDNNSLLDLFPTPILKNEQYNVYQINEEYFPLFSDYVQRNNVAWCVKQREYFDSYGPPYYLITLENGDPYALLHVESGQFKDIHDRAIDIKRTDENIQKIVGYFIDRYVKQFIKTESKSINEYVFEEGTDHLEQYYQKYWTLIGKSPNQVFCEIYKSILNCSLVNGKINCPNDDINNDHLNPLFIDQSNDRLLVSFEQVYNFDVSDLYLTSGDGFPVTINGSFDCSNNKLNSAALENSPLTKIKRNSFCGGNPEDLSDYLTTITDGDVENY